MGYRAGFYALILAVVFLASSGLGLIERGASHLGSLHSVLASNSGNSGNGGNGGNSNCSSTGPIFASEVLASNSGNSGNGGGDNGGNGDNSCGGNSVSVVVVTATPTKGPTPTPKPAAATASAAPQGPCYFQLGFLYLHNLLLLFGIDDGGCVSNEFFNPTLGDSLQLTGRGLSVWEKATNTMRWTDGFRTWTYSKCTIQERLNTQSWAWEKNPSILAGDGPPPPGACDLA